MKKLSKFKLNKAIVILAFPKCRQIIKCFDGTTVAFDDVNGFKKSFDYQNWNDLIPLVEEYKINSIWIEDKKQWSSYAIPAGAENISFHKSKHRCYAECLLKALESKK